MGDEVRDGRQLFPQESDEWPVVRPVVRPPVLCSGGEELTLMHVFSIVCPVFAPSNRRIGEDSRRSLNAPNALLAMIKGRA